jgi:CheY-like chemotaxis protein
LDDRFKILLIDDSEITLALEKSVLEQHDYEVRATSSLLQFENTLKEWRPHLILTDIHMPDVKGTDICRVLKQEYDTHDIPIILFSSLADADLERLAEQVGADGFLSKNHGLEELADKVDELVQSIVW